jgi:hypothetical protein
MISAPMGQRPSPQPYLTFGYGSNLFDARQHETGKAMLARIVSMLIKLAKRLDVD